jgi:choline dehydrogenase-like flavoprotein
MRFDYLIAGGGSAGATLAARLSEDPAVSVCLLEAGGEGRDLLVRVPVGVAAMLPGRPARINNWCFETVPQPGLGGRRGYQPRGKALGGSSAINAMLYVRGHPSDYDDWAALGCEGWAWDDVLPFFRKAEGNSRGADALHGVDGPLKVRDQPSPRAISHAFVDACGRLQIRRNDDFNGAEQEGAGLFQVTQFFEGPHRGERCSAAAAYLHPVMGRPNLTVVTGAHVTRIILDGRRATGLAYRVGKEERTAEASREVILSAGAFGSPQLLLLSGIGPADELKRHGIPVVHDLPGVGRNLQDHLDFVLSWTSRQTDLFGIGLRGGLALAGQVGAWRRDGAGHLSSPIAEAGAFVKSRPDLDRPDLQLHFCAGIVDDHTRRIRLGFGFSSHVCVLRPFSRGTVGLADRNPMSPPRIDPAFLSDRRDADLLLTGAKLMRDILAAEPMAPYRHKELHIDGPVADEALMQHIRARADTIYHPVGTCRMGAGEDAVTDPQLRVRGMEGLRVVDASVMPTLIGGNTNAPTIMIAERAADLMRRAA